MLRVAVMGMALLWQWQRLQYELDELDDQAVERERAWQQADDDEDDRLYWQDQLSLLQLMDGDDEHSDGEADEEGDEQRARVEASKVRRPRAKRRLFRASATDDTEQQAGSSPVSAQSKRKRESQSPSDELRDNNRAKMGTVEQPVVGNTARKRKLAADEPGPSAVSKRSALNQSVGRVLRERKRQLPAGDDSDSNRPKRQASQRAGSYKG